jgi:hypothetical protein
MSRFCTGCGKELPEGASFCTNCGTRAGNIQQSPPQTYYPGYKPPKMKKPKPKWLKITIPVVIGVLVLSLFGFGIWKAGQITGLWNRMAVNRAFDSWEKQKGLKTEQKLIFNAIDDMKAELQAGDLDSAMQYVHPDCRDALKTKLITYSDKIPLLISYMNDCELTYLSTDTGNYESLRMAIVQIGIPTPGASPDMPDTGTGTIVLVESEDGWMVEDIT